MNKYNFGPQTRGWLGQLIGDHFNGRSTVYDRKRHGPRRSNKNLRLVFAKPIDLSVFDGEEQIYVRFDAGSEFVAYRPANCRHGKLAAIFDPNGGQYVFIADSNRLVYRSADELEDRVPVTIGHSRSRLADAE